MAPALSSPAGSSSHLSEKSVGSSSSSSSRQSVYCVIAGDYLRLKYQDSTRVKPTRGGRLRLHRRSVRIPTANDLVFIKESPDYCHHNSTTGSLGQSGKHFSAFIKSLDADSGDISLINVLNITKRVK